MAEPITLAQAKAQLRVDGDDEDEVIGSAIVAARGWIESYTGLILTRREVREVLPSFDHRLRSWPIVSIDSVTYLDTGRIDQILSPAAYSPALDSRPARLLGASWPGTFRGSRISIVMTAGFDGADEIEACSPNLLQAMRQLVAAFFNDRETGGLSGDARESAQDLCRPFKGWRV